VKFKLDENFDLRLVFLVEEGGHDVETVQNEGLSGCQDQYLYNLCVTEQRTLITLDMDFSNPFRFPPEPTAGIVVVRPPRPVLSLIRATLSGALPQIKTGAVQGNLWIVEPGRIRVYEP
jgi:predicted nuclease of predicted toxin-antitoxin system